jgi:hypothetical protein
MTPEHSTARNEPALSQAVAIHPVRGRRGVEPLRYRMLFADQDGLSGHQWRR